MIIKIDINNEKNISDTIKKVLLDKFNYQRKSLIAFLIKDNRAIKQESVYHILKAFALKTVDQFIEEIDTPKYKFGKKYLNAFGYIAQTVEYDYNEKKDTVNIKFVIANKTDSMIKTSWDYIHSMADILNSQYFKKDFSNNNDFASIIDISSASLTKYKKVSAFIKKHENEPGIEKVQINKLYFLSMIRDFDLTDILEYCGGYEGISKTSEKEVGQICRDLKNF